ncbi:probable rhamnogalacturonate lyase B [Olea europaea subsp. europaea]|uniref:rhamnogalacturonan endolyase n=1 Tax=Olea europaea subsp. europaea TaxID=158383 RepID=A0A8S0THF6_OLEEU|nr:probable rhamnogalacturonate lyase B [Olea europaea subsp. europaea]
MEKAGSFLFFGWLGIAFHLFLHVDCAVKAPNRYIPQNRSTEGQMPFPAVKLHKLNDHVVMDNGIVSLTLSSPSGMIVGIQYKEIENILEYRFTESGRGLEGTNFRVIVETEDQIEVSFMKTWKSSLGDNVVPLNIDKRFIMLRGVSGFYSYGIMEHLDGWPDLNIDEARIAFKLNKDMFDYIAISDDMQRTMPTEHDRTTGQALAYKEAVLLKNPHSPTIKGEVDDKYQYSRKNKDDLLHGWISTNRSVGFWIITPSYEFRAGGPLKPDLTSHVGPTTLAIFLSSHYAGPDFRIALRDGEPWKKVFGPVFIYLNSDLWNTPSTLWADAKNQMLIETKKWPYDFPLSKDFPHANERGAISGRLFVFDKYMSLELIPAKSAYVGLAPPGHLGSWQEETKGYQFWTETDEMGYFTIRNVRASTYHLNAWVIGFIGDYKYKKDIVIKPGIWSQIQLGDLIYEPPRNGPTLWEIGIPDRTAAEFYVPDPAPGFTTQLSIKHADKFRQYGLWDRYTDLYPNQDLVYRIGISEYRYDWFFAHVNRKISENNYQPTTWQISFDLTNVFEKGSYTLQLALASATYAEIQVRINNPNAPAPYFTTMRIGKDNAIARHGIYGLYWLYSIKIQGIQFMNGTNTIYLKQSRGGRAFIGVMYDYIRLEAPKQAPC